MSIYFTSDSHFGHENVIRYSGRPFASASEMDAHLIKEWNSIVLKTDQVYHLGDFSLANKTYAENILNQLNGQIFLVRGNHDHKDIRKITRFAWIKDYYEVSVQDVLADRKQKIVLCHYPMESWNGRHHGSFHLHGHSHGSMPSPEWQSRLDVGVDVHNYRPISFEQIRFHMSHKIFKPVDHHNQNTNE